MFFNILRGGITFATTMLLARYLGAEDYGRMAFLLASFLAFKSLMDMYSSHAFFTFLSQKVRSKKFINMYWLWMGLQLFFSLCLIGFMLPDWVLAIVWVNESRFLIIFALIATFMQQGAWQVASQMAEAQRETIKVQKLGTIIIASHLIIILLLHYLEALTLPILFVLLTVQWAFGALFAARIYVGNDNVSDTFSTAIFEFWVYCKPLIPYVWLAAAGDFLDRWMLQTWGGNTEQGYYAAALNIMVVMSLAVVSVIRIFWKEIAEAYHQRDMALVELLYQRTTRLVYFFGAFIVGASLPWSSEIIVTLLGHEYTGGSITFMLMILYTAHQGLGQLNAVVLFATANSKLQTIIGSISIIFSFLLAYYILAPETVLIPGLNMGAAGLAWKMLIMNFLTVNVFGYFLARKFDWKYEWFFQFLVLGVLILAGYLAKALFFGVFEAMYSHLISSSLVYFVLVCFLCYFFPSQLLGVTKSELDDFLSNIGFMPRWR